MKRLFLISGLLMAYSLIFAQNTAEYKLNDFTKIRAWGEFKVYLVKGDELKARVVTKGMPASDITINVKGNTLEIMLKGKIYESVNADIYVTYNQINKISLSAASSVSIQDTLKAENLTIDVNTSSELDGAIQAESAEFTVGQGSTLRLRGDVKSFEAKVNTGGILSALDLASEKAYVKVSTGGIAKVKAIKELEAKVRTGGSLTYTGNPELKDIKTFIGAKVVEQ
ncbi:head GIN domain-containing protein [Tenuifilum thalassicum]|uniref:DUF2807 domain-containing protein n=1 Tax=Tenuifilum thalassicum TaxID=2590900 RepID=A0A7D4BJW9_9BACT|nr:head GIN domain-containing protein [Tenuifilum thalassicum]QKG79879.1 DUF2807 domain-containing protein [Tenuifilum thalassicum]